MSYADPYADPGDPSLNAWRCFAYDARHAAERFEEMCGAIGEEQRCVMSVTRPKDAWGKVTARHDRHA